MIRSNYIYIYIYIYIFLSVLVPAQEVTNLKVWKEIPCEGIEQVNCSYMWGCETGTSQYILSYVEELEQYNLYKFTANENQATLELSYEDTDIYPEERPYFDNETTIYDSYYDGLEEYSILANIDLETGLWYNYLNTSGDTIDVNNGQCFLMNNTHYFLDYNNNTLYQLDLTNVDEENGTLTPHSLDSLKYTSIAILSIVVLKDKFYYLSQDGLCEVSISGNQVTYELIPSVTTTDFTTVLVTDKQNRIWIMNRELGILEYDTTNKNATQIAQFPGNVTALGLKQVCFYSNNYLYYIFDGIVYSLDVKRQDPDNPDPDNPKKPLKSWIGPIAPMIEGGYEFKGLAEFFGMYFSILCNGIPMMFAFDPKMHAFNLAPKAPQFDPANMNNAFMNDRFFYIYNADRNTITCTDTMTGMSKEIACYENMPEDIIQIVVANNQFFILTKSGENHIAQMAGSNLKYVTSWTLDGWTPRTGASIATVKNAIYVFGGKAISEDSKEKSGTCYNELYVYDFNTGSSEKLAVDSDVTARYDAKLLASKRWGKLWIISGKDASDSTASDVWEYNTHNQEWTYINDLPTKDGNASASYDEESDNLSLCITPEETTESRLFSSHPKMHKTSKDFSSRAKTRKASRAFSSHAKTRETSKNFSSRAKTRDISRASSGAVIYQIKDLSVPENAKDQSGKSCGCLGLEFILILAGLCFLRKSRK